MISEKIVIVDDDPRIHQSLKVILFEYELISFLDPHKALEFFSKPNNIKMAIVDVCMQGLNGIELLERIKQKRKDLAVMIITAHGSQDIVVESLRLHADDYIEKPFDVPVLKERVKCILKEKSKHDPKHADSHNQMERIRQFIERNYSDASLEFLAKELCMSPQYLGRLFARYHPKGFRGYKLKVRMDKAKELLCHTSMDVAEIAYQLGYENPESFMRIFKKQVKLPPGKYRDQHRTHKRP